MRRGFSLIELMIALFIMTALMSLAVNEYLQHIWDARITRCKTDLEEIGKTVRLYNIREDKTFEIGTFTFQYLGNLIGTYFEKEPPLDPWKRPYLHAPRQGVVYSVGEDGIDGTQFPGNSGDDVVVAYIPRDFFITKALYVDGNQNNQVDYGDFIDVYFSRPARFKDVTAFDFVTGKPEKGLGSAVVEKATEGQSVRIYFVMPIRPTVRINETTIKPREYLESIEDFSPAPQRLNPAIEAVIQRKRMQ
jgi:prepilin-type N-terminal cleavage/methylation domain-containing protein